MACLRALLAAAGVPHADQYRSHDLRRGHAQDLVELGATLAEILAAGEWRSASFTKYVDLDALEAGAVLEAHYLQSEDED